MNIEFDEVKELFTSNEIWSEGKEINFYRLAWEALKKGGLTNYNNKIERDIVRIRAYTLIMIYREFCDLAFDIFFSYEFADWEDITGINDFDIGLIVGHYFNKYEYLENYGENMLDEIFMELVLDQRYDVVNALSKNVDSIGQHTTLFIAMYIATVYLEDIEDSNFKNPQFLDVDKFNIYKKEIEDYYNDIMEIGENQLWDAYSWVLDGTHKIGHY